MSADELTVATRLAVAGIIGLAVGLEREWSGHASGPDARFAGIRTFLMLGLIGGVAGILAHSGHETGAGALLAGAAGFVVVAYLAATRRENASLDGTTEAGAIAVVALGALAGIGWLAAAASVGSVIVLALSEKSRLHDFVRHVDDAELHAALQFVVLAIVVLPLLPEGPIWSPLDIKPRALWTVVLLFCALNFAGYLARRMAGAGRGYWITGALGGLISSTGVTLTFSRQSRVDESIGIALARGVIAACTVLVPRVLAVSAALNPAVTLALLPRVLPPLAVGLVIVLFAWREHGAIATTSAVDTRSPLRLGSALQMAVAFQIAISVIAYVLRSSGSMSLYAMAAALGLTDMDALTVSMSTPSTALPADVAARALALGILANTVLKLGMTLVVGRARFRRATAAGLLALAAASALGFAFG